MKRFGRSEASMAGLVYVVYEAAEMDDWKGGTRVATFLRESDARAFLFPSQPPRIETPCPACGARTLFVGTGGHLTCSVIGCPSPSVRESLDVATHEAGRLAMAVLQEDLADAKHVVSGWRIAFDERGPYIAGRRRA